MPCVCGKIVKVEAAPCEVNTIELVQKAVELHLWHIVVNWYGLDQARRFDEFTINLEDVLLRGESVLVSDRSRLCKDANVDRLVVCELRLGRIEEFVGDLISKSCRKKSG